MILPIILNCPILTTQPKPLTTFCFTMPHDLHKSQDTWLDPADRGLPRKRKVVEIAPGVFSPEPRERQPRSPELSPVVSSAPV